jgi:hypothetical protein
LREPWGSTGVTNGLPPPIPATADECEEQAVSPLWKHFRLFVGRALIMVLVGFAVFLALDPQGSWEDRLGSPATVLVGCVLGLGFLMAVAAAVRYQKPMKTRVAVDVLDSLGHSGDPYCLVLRPFGHAGTTVLRRWAKLGGLSPTLTLEHTLALSMRATLGLETYAIVDQKQKFAPPGPTYLRASDEQWWEVATKLIDRAAVIILFLPAGQTEPVIRQSFGRELAYITHRELQSRVLLVLPPPPLAGGDQTHGAAHYQACTILGTLEGFAGTVPETDPLRIHRWELEIPQSTLMIKPFRYNDLMCKHVLEPRIQFIKKYRGRVVHVSYDRALKDITRNSPWPTQQPGHGPVRRTD